MSQYFSLYKCFCIIILYIILINLQPKLTVLYLIELLHLMIMISFAANGTSTFFTTVSLSVCLCLFVSAITRNVTVEFCEKLTNRYYAPEEKMIKFWKFRVRIMG